MSIEKEKLLRRNEIYDGQIIHVFKDQVELAGRETVREVVLHCGAAAIIPVTDEGEVLFVRQYRYPVEEALLEIPAGKMDPGETPDECALRELEEETGYTGRLEKLGYVYTTPGFCNETIHLYLATELVHKKQHLDEGEFLDVIRIPLKEVWDMVREGKIYDAKTLSAFAIAHDRLAF
ncbi:NUDIX hydrolase [Dialister sp.]|jgi:ADP-ribose pyrophosphatase|uniref:NUDIX hydrolase n=1 Tax=Dialister sp. TaxID=1955814 RepID=UPI002E81FD39|nr:NUDIX hydrolase [Dialister sp.]MEE3453598.1 NUDIX hydrolase [Dialister sp.]